MRTLLYGVLLPGPHIGRRARAPMQDIARRGFEVGVHTWDHVRWQDGVARASESWTRRELTRARDEFSEVFGRAPLVHGAAGWQMNRYVPALERELGFRYASDTRGSGPFVPLSDQAAAAPVPQLPTTLPTLDELIGRTDLHGADPVDHLLALTSAAGGARAGVHAARRARGREIPRRARAAAACLAAARHAAHRPCRLLRHARGARPAALQHRSPATCQGVPGRSRCSRRDPRRRRERRVLKAAPGGWRPPGRQYRSCSRVFVDRWMLRLPSP